MFFFLFRIFALQQLFLFSGKNLRANLARGRPKFYPLAHSLRLTAVLSSALSVYSEASDGMHMSHNRDQRNIIFYKPCSSVL